MISIATWAGRVAVLAAFALSCAGAQAQYIWKAILVNGYAELASGTDSTQIGAANVAIANINSRASTYTNGLCAGLKNFIAKSPNITDAQWGTWELWYTQPQRTGTDPATGGAIYACNTFLYATWPIEFSKVAAPANYQIGLSGPSRTRALVAGPALVQTATVTQDGAPAAGRAVTISIAGGAAVGGTTDASGQFRFTYVPPFRRPTVDALSASCDLCVNVARKNITVDACDLCEPTVGNPIQPATGEKIQSETDWTDSNADPLTITRTYRSFANRSAGLGAAWSHNWDASLSFDNLEAVVQLGDGRTVVFRRGGLNQPWTAQASADTLTAIAGGFIYRAGASDASLTFDQAGRPQAITQRNGWSHTIARDSQARVAAVTNAFGRSLVFGYDAAGHLTSITTPAGVAIGYGFDTAGRLTAAGYADGTRRDYLYENAQWPDALTGIIDEKRVRIATFTYDANGLAVSTQHAGAQTFSMAYPSVEPVGRLLAGTSVDASVFRLSVGVSDPLGSARTYEWTGGDGSVRMTGASAGGGLSGLSSRALNPSNLAASETDFLGTTTAYAWDSARRLKTATTQALGLPEARTTTTEWHPSLSLPLRISESGRNTAFTYDERGNTLSETVTDTATGVARAWQWTYNAQGLAETMTEPKGGLWRYGYDAAGNLTSEKNPLGQQTTYSHDAAGRVLTRTEPNGLVTSYAYDLRGRLLSQTRGGEVSSFTYEPTGLLASAHLPNGLQVSYSYDAAQRLIAAADNRGNSITYTLDAMGNRVREEVKDANGHIALATGRVINALNRVAAIQGSVGQTTALSYDANGEPVSTTDALNQTTRQTLDGLRRTTATTFADNTAASQAWNALDQLTRLTDPKGVATTYQTNAFGEVMSETSPDIGTLSYTRDANGEVIAMQDAKGQISRIERDALGRVSVIEYAQDHVASFSYDAGGQVSRIEDKSGSTVYTRDAQGRVIAKTQAVNDNPSNPTRHTITYTYEGGDLTGARYPSGLKVLYRRSAGRITGIDVQAAPNASGKQQPVTPFIAGLTHTALGQPKAWAWNSGDTANRTFDADGHMTGNEFASYGWDAASRITSITQSLWAHKTVTAIVNGKPQTTTQLYQSPITWAAGYDVRNRLTSFARTGASTTYSYDANSNRLSAVETSSSELDLEAAFDAPNFTESASQSLDVDAASNKLLGFSQTLIRTQGGTPVGSATSRVNYSVDANGAMTSDGLRTFEYDESRRLAKVRILKDGEAAAVDYLHNALGQRVFKSQPLAEQTLPNEEDLGPGFINWLRKSFGWLFTQGNSPKSSLGLVFAYDEDANLIGEYDNGSAQGLGSTEYIWLPVEGANAIPVGIYRNGKFYQVHSDHLGTPRLVTDSTNAPVWQWPYSAFGNNRTTGVLAATSTSNGAVALKGTKAPVTVNLRFPGQYFDEESHLSYNGFRSFQQGQGRYSQADSIGLAGGLNRFGYVGASPLDQIDPLGLQATLGWCGTGPLGCAAGVGALILMSPPGQAALKDAGRSIARACEGDPCEELNRQIQDIAGKLRSKIAQQHRDQYKLFALAREVNAGGALAGKGTWAGHDAQLTGLKTGLKRKIAEAGAAGCPVSPDIVALAESPNPEGPAR